MKAIGIIAAMVAAIATLSPGSTVLCIAPGGHVAVEEINARCCASTEIRGAASHQQGYESSSAADCGNCMDFLVAPDGYGVISKVFHISAPDPSAAERFGDRVPEIVSGLSPELRKSNNINSLTPACFSTLLRC